MTSQVKSTSGDGLTSAREYVADVHPAVSGMPFRATIQEPGIATNFWPPSIGDQVSVLVDAKSGKVKFDKDDPRLDAKARIAANKAAFEATAEQAVGTGPDAHLAASRVVVVKMEGPLAADPAQRLAKLEAMRQQGLISGEELAAARQRIIDAV